MRVRSIRGRECARNVSEGAWRGNRAPECPRSIVKQPCFRDPAAPMRPGCGYFQPPLSEKRARGTPDARCVRSLVCESVESTRVSSPRKHRKRPAFRTRWSVGLLRALPGNGRNLLAVVSAGSRRRPDLDASAADRISVGTTRFGPPREAIRMGRISTPVRTAQRRRPPRCPASRGFQLRSGPCGRRSSAGPRPGRRTAARRCRVHRIPPREP